MPTLDDFINKHHKQNQWDRERLIGEPKTSLNFDRMIDSVDDVDEFLRAHFNSHPEVIADWFGSRAILKAIPISRRAQFVVDAFVSCGARNWGWTNEALRHDIPAHRILDALHMYAHFVELDEAGLVWFHELNSQFSYGFLSGVCTPENQSRLLNILRIMADRTPDLAIKSLKTIAEKMDENGRKRARALQLRAIRNLDSAYGIRPTDLTLRVPLQDQIRLSQRLRWNTQNAYANALFVLRLIMQAGDLLGDEWAHELLGQQRPNLSTIPVNTLYRAARSALDGRTDLAVTSAIRELFYQRLHQERWLVGKITEGRRGRSGNQKQLEVVVRPGRGRTLKFIPDKDSHRHLARKGDWVIFNSRGVRTLVDRPNIKVVVAQFVRVSTTGTIPVELGGKMDYSFMEHGLL